MLSDVLSAMRTGEPYAARSKSHAPWGFRFTPGDAAGCHVVLQGGCWLVPTDGEPLALGVGDVLFAPHGTGHVLADEPGRPTVDFHPTRDEESPVGELRIPGSGAVTELLCASYSFERVRPHPLLGDLPEIIHFPARVGQHVSLRAAVDLLGDELREPRAGTDAILPSLIDMLLLYILRAWFDEQADRPDRAVTGWASAFGDPAMSRALRRIHRRPEHPWTVAELASEAGLSRAFFAKRFASVVGQPPLAYLTWWRMTTAARLLRGSDAPLRAVAERCGYSSEFAFAKAFKRAYGVAPGKYRTDVRDGAVL